MKKIYFTLMLPFSINAFADNIINGTIKSKQKQENVENNLFKHSTTLGIRPHNKDIISINSSNDICLPVYTIKSNLEDIFPFLISELKQKSGFTPGMCLNSDNLLLLKENARNILIKRGFITSYVDIENQDLNSGELILSVYPGYIAQIWLDESGKRLNFLGRNNILAVKSGDILNLRDIEQTLENLKKIPATHLDIKIEASDKEQHSNIIISREQTKRINGGISIDNFGSKSSGKYLLNSYLSVNNISGMNDIIYFSYYQDSGHHKEKYTDSSGHKTKSGMMGYGIYYHIPYGYWQFGINYNESRNNDAEEGAYTNYLYKGKTKNLALKAEHILYRDETNRVNMEAKLWHNSTRKYLGSDEIRIQRRKTSGWKLEFNHEIFLTNSLINYAIIYTRGTGFRSLRSPEEFNENNDIIPGTSRMKIINAQVNLHTPFTVNNQVFSIENTLFLQWNKTPLVPQDKLSIGGIYNVRGFDGEESISGEKGFYNQNTLNWHYFPQHTAYIGIDYGRVSGISTTYLESQSLLGGIIGFKGKVNLAGNINYNLFVGKPFKKPDNFNTDRMSIGFSFGYNF